MAESVLGRDFHVSAVAIFPVLRLALLAAIRAIWNAVVSEIFCKRTRRCSGSAFRAARFLFRSTHRAVNATSPLVQLPLQIRHSFGLFACRFLTRMLGVQPRHPLRQLVGVQLAQKLPDGLLQFKGEA